MDTRFVYDIPTKVYFGKDQLDNLGAEIKKLGNKVLLLTYAEGPVKTSGLYDQAMTNMKNAGVEVVELSDIAPNPRVSSVNDAAKVCREQNIEVILGIGGGSVIDCAKLVSLATYYDGDAWDFATGVAKVEKHLPVVAITTIAATGSEMDTSAVISNPETNQKIVITIPEMAPAVSFLDPTNTYSVPAFQTASGTADILSHVMETYFDMNGDLYMLDAIMEGIMKTVIKYGPIALAQPDNYEARANLQWASCWAINSFIWGGKPLCWSCHPIEHELSAFYDITHGLGLAIVTPKWMRHILNEKTAHKFYQYGVNVFGINPDLSEMEVANAAIEKTEEFFYQKLGLASTLTEVGIDATHFDEMAKSAVTINPAAYMAVPLTAEDVKTILEMSL